MSGDASDYPIWRGGLLLASGGQRLEGLLSTRRAQDGPATESHSVQNIITADVETLALL